MKYNNSILFCVNRIYDFIKYRPTKYFLFPFCFRLIQKRSKFIPHSTNIPPMHIWNKIVVLNIYILELEGYGILVTGLPIQKYFGGIRILHTGLGFCNMFFFVRMEIVHLGIYTFLKTFFWFLSSSQFNALIDLFFFSLLYDRILNSIKIILIILEDILSNFSYCTESYRQMH